ncbi:hypothetical protein B0T20DRAFT_455904 [Sordaria brevicollis]|uniref:Uncharacterized protein n=1 Tax=Sordaria brevicollis TaxID=83679 RepID=A0AAE0U6H0_SORBR|nr:hypothetical protein B0T20DRAFT_455904 [Sordaria brevicollis]
MSGLRADSPIRGAVGDSGGAVAGYGTRAFSTHLSNFQKYLRSHASVCSMRAITGFHVLVRQPNYHRKWKILQDAYPGLSSNKSTIGIQPLPRHRELQNESCDIVSYPTRRSSSDVFRRRTASEFTKDPFIQCVENKRANRASYSCRVVVSATRSYGVPSPVPVAYHAGKGLKTLDPATTALLAGRYCKCVALHPSRLVGCWAAPLWSGRLAGFDVRFSLLTEQLLVKVGTVKWLQIEAIPL